MVISQPPLYSFLLSSTLVKSVITPLRTGYGPKWPIGPHFIAHLQVQTARWAHMHRFLSVCPWLDQNYWTVRAHALYSMVDGFRRDFLACQNEINKICWQVHVGGKKKIKIENSWIWLILVFFNMFFTCKSTFLRSNFRAYQRRKKNKKKLNFQGFFFLSDLIPAHRRTRQQ